MWKKLIFKVVVMVIIFMGLGSYGAYLTGAPIPIFNAKNWASIKHKFNKTLDSFSMDKVKPQAAPKTPEGLPAKGIYKWRDASGGIHFGERPPAGALEVQALNSSDFDRVNVVAPTKIPEPEEVVAEQENDSSESVMPNPYSPEGVKEIMDQAKDVKKQMEERMQQQQDLLKEI